MSNKVVGTGVVNTINQVVIKPVVVAGLCIAADKYLLQEPYLENSLYFGASAGAGVWIASTSGVFLEKYIASETFFDSATAKTVESRIIEVAFGSAAYLAVSKFVMNLPFNKDTMIKKLGVLILADVFAETFTRVIDDII